MSTAHDGPRPAHRDADVCETGDRHVRVVVNPHRADDVEDLLAATHGTSGTSETMDQSTVADRIEVVRPDEADELTAVAARGIDDGADTVAAVGGDGTQRGVADAVAHTDAALAVVPAGTVNLLGRVLGVDTIDDAVAAIGSGRTRAIDLGHCNGEPFLLNASSGYDADVIDHVGDRAKRLGRLGYLAVGLARLVAPQTGHVRVSVDGRPCYRGAALSVLVMNVGNRGSTRFRIAPDAEPDDGRLDVVVLTGRRRSLLRAGWAIARGATPRADDVVSGQGARIEVEWRDETTAQRDGDADGRGTRFVYDADPGAVRVRVPG